jgi:hypothetical protein
MRTNTTHRAAKKQNFSIPSSNTNPSSKVKSSVDTGTTGDTSFLAQSPYSIVRTADAHPRKLMVAPAAKKKSPIVAPE